MSLLSSRLLFANLSTYHSTIYPLCLSLSSLCSLPSLTPSSPSSLPPLSLSAQVRNRSLINRNIIGDTGIHAVTTEIERLRSRLDERSNEFEHLRDTQLRDSNENNALKVRMRVIESGAG